MSRATESGVGFDRPLSLVMGVVYAGAGVAHFLVPDTFTPIVPRRLPHPKLLVYLSGIAEVVLGIGVCLRRTRRLSAWGIVALLVAVFPANVSMATRGMVPKGVPDRLTGLARLALWVRLPFQGVLIRWALRYTR